MPSSIPIQAARTGLHVNHYCRRQFLRQSGLTLALSKISLPFHSLRESKSTVPLRILIWCEGTAPRSIYPDDIDGAIAQILKPTAELELNKARLTDPEAGLSDSVLDSTDVLLWWGRLRHDDVPESRSAAVVERVHSGKLGLVALHTAFASKPFRSLMGMPCEPRSWQEEGRPEHVEIASPGHPLAHAVKPFMLAKTTMFLEPFHVPEPETVFLRSSWDQGPSFRSGMAWTREQGRVVYLRAADDSFPVLFHPSVRQLILNAVSWAGHRS